MNETHIERDIVVYAYGWTSMHVK